MENQVKIAVIEQKLEDLKPIILRIDTAIEKMSEVNTSVSRMLAIHEERISKQEEVDVVLFSKVDKLRDKMDINHNCVLARIQRLEKKVWIMIGCATALSFLLNSPFYQNNNNFKKILTSYKSTPIITGSRLS